MKEQLDRTTLLIAFSGHFIGTRPFPGGRYWKFRGVEYPYRTIGFVEDDIVHGAIVVEGLPEMVTSHDVPAPFDRWAFGAAVIPESAISLPTPA